MVLVAYGNALEAGFAFDSGAIVLGSPHITAATWDNLATILSRDYWWPSNTVGNYRPLTTLSYLVNYAVLGNADRALGYHALNLALHWLDAVLVYLLSTEAARIERRPAFLIAALFAAHPLGSEAVTNIVGRADLLAAAAVLGGVLLHERAQRAAGVRRVLWRWALGVTVLLGLLSKENAISVVPLIIAYDLILAEGPLSSGSPRERIGALLHQARTDWVHLLWPLGAFLALRAWVYQAVPPFPPTYGDNALVGLDFLTARLTVLKTLARSLALLVWPATLCPDYSVAEVTPFGSGADPWEVAKVIAAVAAVALAAVVAILALRRGHRYGRALVFFGVLSLLTWLPTSNAIILIGATMAERFLYLPQIGVLATFVLWLEMALPLLLARTRPPLSGPRAPAIASWALLGAAVLALAIRAYVRNADWRDDLTLWTAAATSCPGSYRSHQALAVWLARASERDGDEHTLDEAIAEGERGQEILARSAPQGHLSPAIVLENLGTFYLAKASFEDARDGENDGSAGDRWRHKAVAALEQVDAWYRSINERRRAEAEHQQRGDGLGFDVGLSSVYDNLGGAYLALEEPEKARAAFLRLRELAPRSTASYVGLASVELARGGQAEALSELLKAFLLDPARADIAERLLAVDRELHPPAGCVFTERAGAYTWNADCPETHGFLCRAYRELEGAFRKASRLEPAERAEAIRQVEELVTADGCALPGK